MRRFTLPSAVIPLLLVKVASPAATSNIGGRTYTLVAKCPNAHYDVALTLRASDPKALSPIDLVFAASSDKDFYRLLADTKGTELSVCQAGQTRRLARVGGLGKAGKVELLIKRHERSLRIYANGHLLVQSFDTTHDKGVAAVVATGWTVKAARHQKRGEVVFADSFMRGADQQELAPWAKASGKWRFHSVTERHEQAKVANTSNPFSLGGTGGSGAALVTTGHVFWDDYDFAASFRSQGGAVGIAYNYRNQHDYWLARLSIGEAVRLPCLMELIRVLGGKRRVVSKAHVTAAAGQWYRLRVATEGTRATVFFDDWPVFDVDDATAMGGKIGLFTEGQTETVFDDVAVRPTDWLRFDRAAAFATGGGPSPKAWTWKEGKPPVLSPIIADCTLHFGGEQWQRYVVRATLTFADQAQWLGLGAGKLLFRVGRPGGKGAWQAQWLNMKNPKAPSVLAKASVPMPKSRSVEVELDLTQPRFSKAYFNRVLVLRVPRDAKAGRPSLYSHHAQGSTFAGLAVGRQLDRDWETRPSNKSFVEDPFMTNWATARGSWVPVSGKQHAYWHCGDCYGFVRLSAPLQQGICLTLAGDGQAFGRGYEATAALRSTPKANETVPFVVRLTREGKEVGSAPVVPKENASISLERDGHYVTVECGGKTVASFRAPSPLPTTRLGLRASGEIDLSHVRVTRDQVMDYLFETAPCEWHQSGLWEVTNRFACHPIWAHMTGRSLGAAVLWNKLDFLGDVTVEFYAGLRMRQDTTMWQSQPGSYPRQGDFNATIAADGRGLGAGYSFIICAWDQRWTQRWTRVLRGNRAVAETDRHLIPLTRVGSGKRAFVVPWMPRQEERPVHGAWYFLKARKRGQDLSFHCDNHRILNYRDPKPLNGSRVAIWTQNNSVVLARAKISYSQRRVSCPIVPPPKPQPATPAVAVKMQSSTHPGVTADFEAGICGWQTTGLDQGAFVETDRTTHASGQASLRLTNANAGGDFAVKVPTPALDALHVATLRFHYRLTPDVRVNVYFRLKGDLHFIQLTGETYSNENVKKVGAIDGVQPDGKWRRATFDLGAGVRALYPLATSLPLTDVRLGNFHEGYLTASIGGNGAGAVWHIDDFVLATAAPAPAKFAWEASGPLAVSFEREGSKPSAPKPVTAKEASLSPAEPGLHMMRLWTKDGNEWRQAGAHAAFVQAQPLAVVSVDPKPASKWHGEPIRVQFGPTAGCHPSSVLILAANGTRVPADWTTTSYDAGARTLTFDVSSCIPDFAHGQRIDWALQFSASAASNPRRLSHQWHYVMDREGDKLPPSKVSVSGYFAHCTFEKGLDGWQPNPDSGYAKTVVDCTTAAAGKRSLKCFNRIVGGMFFVLRRQREFNAGKYPLMMFRYKLDPLARTDFLVHVASHGWMRQIGFTDNSDYYGRLGSIAGVIADSKWHGAEVNLRQALATQGYHPRMFHLSSLFMADCPGFSNGPTQQYHIDELIIAPVLSAVRGLKLKARAFDPSGIKGLSWHWSAKSAEDANQQVNGPSHGIACTSAPEGKSYLHVRAQDNAGNWGPTSHWPFMIDNTAPSVQSTGLWAKNLAAASRLTLKLADGGSAGVDPETLAVKVNGNGYAFDPLFTEYQVASGSLSWEWCLATGLFGKPVPNGTEVNIDLPTVADFAGNRAKPFALKTKVDFASDKEPPLPPEVSCSSQPAATFDTFTKSLGQWANWGGRWTGWPERIFSKARGHHCLRVVNKQYNSTFGVYVRSAPFDVAKTPWVSFEYNFPKTVKVHFLVHVAGQWYAMKLTAATKQPSYPTIGSVPGIVPDGKWHTARFNLHDVLAKGIKGGLPTTQVRYLTIAAYQSLYNAAGARYYIDDFAIYGAGSHKPVFDVAAVDPSGIKAYAYVMDTKPNTVPPRDKPVSSGAITPPPPTQPGHYYLHVCAQDGAGNWSHPTHFPYHVATVPQPPVKKPTAKAAK